MEKGEINLTGKSLVKIAKALDVSTDYLLGLTDDPRPVIEGPAVTLKEWAIIAAISLLAFAGLSCAILTMPIPWLDQIGATFTAGLPTNALAVGAIIGSVASAGVAAVWMIRQRARRGSEGGSLSRTPNIPPGESGPPAPPLKPPTEAPRPLTYLEHRKPK